jgi:hypothetical protein
MGILTSGLICRLNHLRFISKIYKITYESLKQCMGEADESE